MNRRATMITIDGDYCRSAICFRFHVEDNILYFDGKKIESIVPGEYNEYHGTYLNYKNFGENIAATLSNFHPAESGDLYDICCDDTEVIEFFETVVIMLLRNEQFSTHYAIENDVLTVESTGKTHTFGQFFINSKNNHNKSMYDIIKDLHY